MLNLISMKNYYVGMRGAFSNEVIRVIFDKGRYYLSLRASVMDACLREIMWNSEGR